MASRGIFSQLTELARAVADAARSTPPADEPQPPAREPAREPAQRAPRLRREPTPAERVEPAYAPERDGEPDPGEVVWAWVPYEEDASRGKDRPVLVLSVNPSRRGREVVALMLTSKEHADAERDGRRWMDVGTGGWDSQGRPSEVRLDRVLHLDASAVRREGSALDERVFTRVADAASRLHGW